MTSHFFAMLFRMKYIDRWALMRNTRKETLSEHTLETAFIAHALAVIHNKRFGGNVCPEKIALAAMFHDVPEIITGDLPTPVKYYNEDIKSIYGEIEASAKQRLISLLPEDLKNEYKPLLDETDEETRRFVKAADKISALIKCKDELRLGNTDFAPAEKACKEAVNKLSLPASKVFIDEFLDSFSLSLDEQQ